MSGPSSTTAYIVNAFGEADSNVTVALSESSFREDFSHGAVYTYPGAHGVTIRAQTAAYLDFANHLPSPSPSARSPRPSRRPRPMIDRHLAVPRVRLAPTDLVPSTKEG
jgi:hypothetical protein